jgi:WD40 repeat protein
MSFFRAVTIALLFIAGAAAAEKQGHPQLRIDAGGHTDEVGAVLFSPSGKELISVSHDKTIRVWNTSTGEIVRVLRPPISIGHHGEINGAALSRDGERLAIVGFGWERDQGQLYFPVLVIHLASGQIEHVLDGHTATCWSVAFSPDGKQVASTSSDQTTRVWSLPESRCKYVLQAHTESHERVVFSPDGTQLVTTSNDHLAILWSLRSGKLLATLRGHGGAVRAVAWSPDGKTIATGSADRTIRLWNPDGRHRRTLEGFSDELNSLTFTENSARLLFACFDGACGIIEAATGKIAMRFQHDADIVWRGALSPSGQSAATCDGVGDICLWNLPDGTMRQRFSGRGSALYSAAWSQDGKTIGWGNTYRNDDPNGHAPLEFSFRFDSLQLGDAPDGPVQRARERAGGLALLPAADHANRLLVKENERLVSTIQLDEIDHVHSFTLLTQGQVAVGLNWGMGLFDAHTGRFLRDFPGHSSTVWAVAPSPDDRYLLSASSDRMLHIWTVSRELPLCSLFIADHEWVIWTPEGYYATSPGGERLMGWHVNNGPDKLATFYPAAQFRDSLYRPDVIKRLLEAGSITKAMELADAERGIRTTVVDVSEVLPPFVMITSPDKAKVETSEATVDLRFLAKPVGKHPITAVKLLLDGRPYPGTEHQKQFNPPQGGELRQAWTVKLEPGAHTLAVQAESAVSKAVSEPVEVFSGARGVARTGTASDPAVQKQTLPSLYVLAIGISEYPGPLKLNYAAKDAEAIAKTYSKNSLVLFNKVEAKLLTDQQATRRDILQGLTWLRRQMTQNDVAVISFAGHGAKDSDGTFYLLPIDGDLDDLLTTGVPGDQIKRTLAGIPGRFILLLDACHSGAVDGEKRRAGDSLTDDLVRDLVTDDYGVIVMCSAMGREFALESPTVEHGFFTLALVEGLNGKADYNQDSLIHLNEIDLYVTDRVKVLSEGRQHPVTARPTSIRSFPLTKP